MGTNFYAIPKATPELKREIINAVNDENFELARTLLPKKIHIGKSSFGWTFLFNHNNWEYFKKNKASMEHFISKCQLIDEYGTNVSSEDFWDMVFFKRDSRSADESIRISGLTFCTSTDFS